MHPNTAPQITALKTRSHAYHVSGASADCTIHALKRQSKISAANNTSLVSKESLAALASTGRAAGFAAVLTAPGKAKDLERAAFRWAKAQG